MSQYSPEHMGMMSGIRQLNKKLEDARDDNVSLPARLQWAEQRCSEFEAE
jgi:hypothetical protein